MPSPVINELVRNHTGADTNEYVEIFGDPNTDYSNLTLVEIEGDGTSAGNILSATSIGTTDADGFFVTAFLNSAFQNGTSTYLLVSDYTGTLGTDLDTDNDGTLDATPWTAVLDGFALSDGGAGDQVYSDVDLTPDFDGGTFAVGGVSRAVDGQDTDATSDFVRNDFDGQGIPGLGVDTATEGEAINTPGTANQVFAITPTFTINEVDSDTPGSDTAEFIEIYDGGVGNSSLDGLVLVLYNGSDDQSYLSIDLDGQTTDENGFFVVGGAAVANVDLVVSDGFLQNGADAVALIAGDAADFPNDTAIPTENVVDVVVYGTGDADDVELLAGFGETVQADENANGAQADESVGRNPDGDGDFAALTPTPGASNQSTGGPSSPVTINEVDSDTPGSDTAEFIELYDGGAGNTSLDGLVLVLYNGSDDQSYLSIDLTGQTTDENGFFVVGGAAVANVDLVVSDGFLQNGADAVALIAGDAADFPNDTAIPTENVVDVVVYGTGDADDAELLAGFGETVQADENANGNQADESVARAPDGSGDFVAQAPTPGTTNTPPATGIVINEVDSDTPGSDTGEFIELFDGGAGNTSLDGLVLVLYNGSDDQSYLAIDLDGQTTDENGFFVVGGADVPNVDLVQANNFLQNGADAVALIAGDAADFPNDSAITTDNLLDVVVYGTGDADDAGLLAGFGETVQADENANGNQAEDSVARLPDGTGEFVAQTPTPGVSNGTDTGGGDPTPAAIFEIQGAGHISPLVGELVITTGIVTAVDDNGFYLQDPTGDGNANTSDGIFVFTGSVPTVAVGDAAEVTGDVEEFGFSDRLTVTQIDASNVTVTSSGNPLPDAVVIGTGGLTPPTEIIISEDEITTPIDLSNPADAAANNFDPAEDGIDFYEALEGMRVTVQDAIAVSPANGFGEIFTVANQGADATGFNERGGVTATEGDLNPERIQIQIDSNVGPDLDVSNIITGDLLGDVTGVVTYNFGNFEVVATDIGTPVSGGLEAEVTTLAGTDNQLTIASYNVLNLDPSDTEQIAIIAQQIVDNLLSPDVIALQEVQDNNGAASGTVASDQTLQALADAIEAAGGPAYSFAVVDPVAENTQGGQPNGNIRVAYLFNDDRVDLVEGSLQALDEATLAAAGVSVPDAFNGSRIPLAAQFSFEGEVFTVINNHFTSKGGSDDLFGANQPAEENGDDRREGQATALNDYVDSLLAADPDANVVVLGDFNDFDFSTPLDIIEGGSGADQILFNQVETIAADADRYTFIFQGNSQAIDQFLVTGNLVPNTEFDIVHVNADFQTRGSDHDPILGRIMVEAHDPLLLQGDDDANLLEGASGDDTIRGARGDDTLIGNGGDDDIQGGRGADIVDGGAGNDELNGGRGADTVTGGEGDDRVDGDRGNDLLIGGTGNDLLIGNRGDDTLFGGEGDDTLRAGRGADLLDGGSGNDLIIGARAADTITGGEGDDTLVGNRGADTLNGGAGDDVFTGGRGSDVFVFASGDGNDEITDFGNVGDDVIDLTAFATSFESLGITESGDDLLITVGDTTILLRDTTSVSSDDFLF